MNRLFVFAACLALAWLFAPAAFAQDAECTTMTQVIADSNQGAPYMVDQITRSEIATGDCAAKAATFAWTILTAATELNANWHDVLKGNFESGFCGRPELVTVVKAGWAITAKWTTSDGEVFETQVACP